MKSYKEIMDQVLHEAAPKTISDLPGFLDKKNIAYEFKPHTSSKINITGLEMDVYSEFKGRELKFYSTTPEYGTAMYTKFSELMKVINTRAKR